jgi:hypothetical protein
MKRIILFLIFAFCISAAVFAQSDQELLTKAFENTFSSPKAFKDSRVFQILGYDLAETDMIAKITPYPKKLEVKVETDELCENPDNIGFKSISVTCDRVNYYSMVIERVVFIFPNCVLDRDSLKKGTLKFLNADEIQLEVLVSEKDISNVFALFAQAKALTSLEMKLTPNLCKLFGNVKMGFFRAQFEVSGVVDLINPKQVNFICNRMVINKQVQPRNFVSAIIAQINPVFDSTKAWINLNVSDIRITSGFVATKAVINRKVN